MFQSALRLVLLISFFLVSVSSVAHAATTPGPIVGNVVWTKASSPYIVNYLSIPADTSLTIEPGTIVKVVNNGNAFVVDGTLTIGSAGGEQVIITSMNDDSASGDTNGDGSVTTPLAGDWRSITFNPGATGNIVNTSIRYGGASYYANFGSLFITPLIKNNGGTITLDHVTLAQSSNNGLEQFSGTTTITNSTVSDAYHGIANYGGSLTLGNNTFANLGDYGVSVYVATNFINQGGNSGGRGIYMAYSIAGDQTWGKDNIPYVTSGVGIPVGSSLTIAPGAVVKATADACPFYVDGTLTIGSPSAAENAYITSIKDDSLGGDTNVDGGSSIPNPADWRKIHMNVGSVVTITNASIKYGGATPYNSYNGGYFTYPLIENNGGVLTIDHTQLAQSGYYGVLQYAGTTTVSNSTFSNISKWGVYNAHGNIVVASTTFSTMERGIAITEGTIELGGNTFNDMSSYAVSCEGAIIVRNHGGNQGNTGMLLSQTVIGALPLPKDGLVYVVSYLGVPVGSTLTILPGAIVKVLFNTNPFHVDGTLTIGDAASTDKVFITSIKDDLVGGDTNGDATSTTPNSGDWRSITFNTGSSATIENTIIRYGGASPYNPWTGGADWLPAIQNNGGTLAFDHTALTNNGNFGILQLMGTTTIAHSEIAFTDRYGLFVSNGVLTIHDSSIHDNATYGIYNGSANIVDATNNWWGSASGPTHESNPFGTGDKVSDYINYGQWLTVDPSAPTDPCSGVANCYSNVLFLPGIMGSRLYDSTGNVRWLPEDDIEADYVRMNSDGTSAFPDITTKDAIDTADGQQLYTDLYKSFLNEMKTWEQDYQITATTTPYDWRLDYDTVVTKGRKLPNGHISYLLSPEAGHDAYILETLKQLAATSKTGKVTIIGHSQGGLIAKALMQKIGDAQTAQLIDQVILVATPQLGTPKAVAVLLNGTEAGIPLAVSAEKVRQLAQNTQSAYNLLPSANYFNRVDDPVITISPPSIPVWAQHYGDVIHWDGGMRNFMYDADVVRIKPVYSDLNTPEIVDPLKLLRAQDVHTALDNWVPPAGVQLTTVAGWGLETLSGIRYYRECATRNSAGLCTAYDRKITLEPHTVIDGDGTVIEPSAQWGNGADVTRWWVNLRDYNKENTLEGSPKGRDHKNILEVPNLRVLIRNMIIATSTQLNYISGTAPQDTENSIRLHFTLHSPLTLGFTDTLGNYTGSTATSSTFNVPGVDYERYGEVQWLSIPKELAGQLVMHGTGSGSFTLDAEEVNGNSTLSTTSFEGIPSSTSTTVTMSIIPTQSVTGSSTLVVDQDGNGTPDIILQAKQGGVVVLPTPDVTPPVTSATTTGTLGKNGWYTSNILVTLVATDTGSGVASTTYSLNGGTTWLTYTTPVSISAEGTSTLLYRSKDKTGNIEAAKTLTLKIDKTAPEAQISVSTSTQDILVEGTDNLGTTTITKDTSGNYTLADQAGHTTKLFFTKTYAGKQLTFAKLTSMQYDAVPKTNIATSSFLYLWDTKVTPPTLLSQTIAVNNTFLITALYDKKTNKTTVVILKKKVPYQATWFAGLKIIKLTTTKGMVGYSL